MDQLRWAKNRRAQYQGRPPRGKRKANNTPTLALTSASSGCVPMMTGCRRCDFSFRRRAGRTMVVSDVGGGNMDGKTCGEIERLR